MDVVIAPEAAQDGEYKGRWKVRVIRAGMSLNRNYYPEDSLRRAVGLFEGVRVFVKSDQEHLAGGGKDVRNIVGRIAGVEFVPGEGDSRGELHGVLQLVSPDDAVGTKLRDAWDRGMAGMFGLSIDAEGKAQAGRVGGQAAKVLTEFTKIRSVDLVVDPAAGGGIINLIESTGGRTMSNLSTADVRRIVEATRLPGPAREKLIRECSPPSVVTETDLREAICQEADYLASMSESGTVRGLGAPDGADGQRVRIVEGQDEKIAGMLDAFFDPADRSVISIRECYLEATGDRRFTGLHRNCDRVRMTESLGTASFPDVLGDAVQRRLVKEYNTPHAYDVWRDLVSVVPVADFRTQERTRFGGYGDLPIVAERDPYNPLASPTDEKATYAIAKRGGTEDLSLEMIANDDVSAVRRIPLNLARAAKRTVSKFALDFLRDNPVVYDGVTLFHASHGNLGTAALDASSVAAGRKAMKRQTELDSGERLGIGPRFLWVPDEQEEAAHDLFRRDTNLDPDFVQSLALKVRPVWYWTDLNDWCLSVDPMDVPTIEIGFFQGQEEPELFIQDSPTVGSMFTNDVTTYKIRYVFGGNVVDFRGLYKAVVA